MAKKVRAIPKENQIYKHFKGSLYQIVTIAVHTETSDKLVIYRSVEKPERVFARPIDMFMSEVDRLRYPLVKAKYRFTLLVEEDEEQEELPVCEETDDSVLSKDTPADSDNDESDSDDNAVYKNNGELVIDPIVEAVLDKKEFTDKIANFERLRGKCTEEMLTTIAISLDIQLEEGSVEEKYAQILKTLRMHEKYESARLRG